MPSLNALHAWEKHLSSALIMFVIFCSGCCGPGNLYFLSTYKRCSTTPNVFFVTWVQYDEAVQTISLTKISHCRTFKRTSNSLPFVFATSCCSMVISPTPSKNTQKSTSCYLILFDLIYSLLEMVSPQPAMLGRRACKMSGAGPFERPSFRSLA